MASTPTAGDDAIFGDDYDNFIDALQGNDIVLGGNGDDFLAGNEGNDFLNGGTGKDLLYGGNGIDTVLYSFAASGVTASLVNKRGFVTAQGQAADEDIFNSIENLTGSNFNDALEGDGGSNLLRGMGGSDVIDAGPGDDVIQAGADLDNIYAGLGADTIDGGSGFDWLHYNESTAGITVDLKIHTAVNGYASGDRIANVEGLIGSDYSDWLAGDALRNYLTGLDGHDHLAADGGDDVVTGGDGQDSVYGGDGDDWLNGGAGGDEISGGAGFDVYSYLGSNAGVAVDGHYGTASGGHAQGDSFSGDLEGILGSHLADTLRGAGIANLLDGYHGDDVLNGRGGNDTILGGAGKDAIQGNAGADRITGGGSRDTLDGGVGADRYVYGSIGDSGLGALSRDRVIFVAGQDVIDVSAIDAFSGKSGNQAFIFIGMAEFSMRPTTGQIRYGHVGENTIISASIDADISAEFRIELAGHVTLAAADFVL